MIDASAEHRGLPMPRDVEGLSRVDSFTEPAPADGDRVRLSSPAPAESTTLIPSLTQRQRDLLARLAAATARRAAREAEIERTTHAANDAAARAFAEAQTAAHAFHSKAIRTAENEHRHTTARAAAQHAADREAAVERREAEVRAFTVETNSMEGAANERGDERAWLADTLFESASKKARADFDATRTLLEAKSRELGAIEAAAQALLRTNGHAPLPVINRDAPGAEGDLDARGAEAVAGLDLLTSRVRPIAVSPGFVSGGLLVLIAAGAIGGAMLFPPASLMTVMYGGGAGLGLGLLAWFMARALLRRRVPAAAAALAEALSGAASSGKTALKAAEAKREAIIAEARTKRDSEVRAARAELEAATLAIRQRRTVDEPALRRRHDDAIVAIDARLDAAQRTADHVREARRREADEALGAAQHSAQAQRDADLVAAAGVEREAREALTLEFTDQVAAQIAEAEEVRRTSAALCPGWADTSWIDFKPRTAVPEAVSIGEFTIDPRLLPGGFPAWHGLAGSTITQPVLIDFLDRGSLLLRHGADGRATAISALNNAMLRLLTAFPPAKARFTIVDPVGLGQSFAAFMHLADHHELLISDKIWTDPRHIEQKLGELTEHMETVIQKYLRNEFQTIQQYNEFAGEVAEPFRFLVMADFPANLTEQAAKRLASIVTSGPRCGVFTLIALDQRAKLPSWLPVAEMEKAAVTFRHDGAVFARQEDDFRPWPMSFERPPDEDTTTRLLHEVGRLAKDLGKVRVPFEMVAPPADQVWSLDTAEGVRIPLGRAGATKLQHLTLGQGTAQHALIAGRTGSGKSTLLHVIITNLALWCSPDQVELYLVDFKKGVEFKAYATHALPHARVIAVESEREFGLSVLRKLDAELTRRGQLFRDMGVQDVAAYRRAAPRAEMPRTLLIVDEFQEFFVEDDKLSQEASLLLDRLVRQGRAFGMHVILGSQTLGGAYSLARSTLGQMAVRIALQCSEADSYLIMAEDNAAPRLLNRPGEAIYNDASGMVEGNSPFQIVWLPEETREAKLASVRERLTADSRAAPPPAIVFEGNQPADISRNHVLASLRADPSSLPRLAPPQAWLGDAVSIKDPTSMVFRRQSAANLLIVGQQEDAASALLVSAAMSLSAHPHCSFALFDSTPADSPHAGVIASLAERLKAPFAAPRAAAASVAVIAEELAQREANPAGDDAPLFLIIMGLHRFRDLRRSDDFSFGSESEKPAPDKQFARILREGPALGIHTIAWCDTAANLERTLDRQSIREFEARVLFQMSANDSTALVDAPAAANLGRYRAILYREELGTIEKFRPYAMPPSEWLAG